MKKVLILITFGFTFLISGSLSSTEILNMVSKIKEERVGISLVKLEGTSNPFILQKKKKVEEKQDDNVTIYVPVEIVYKVDAILNHAAFINKKWYRTGDRLGEYRVGYVSKYSVTLEKENGNRVLKLERKKKKFIKLNQGRR